MCLPPLHPSRFSSTHSCTSKASVEKSKQQAFTMTPYHTLMRGSWVLSNEVLPRGWLVPNDLALREPDISGRALAPMVVSYSVLKPKGACRPAVVRPFRSGAMPCLHHEVPCHVKTLRMDRCYTTNSGQVVMAIGCWQFAALAIMGMQANSCSTGQLACSFYGSC